MFPTNFSHDSCADYVLFKNQGFEDIADTVIAIFSNKHSDDVVSLTWLSQLLHSVMSQDQWCHWHDRVRLNSVMSQDRWCHWHGWVRLHCVMSQNRGCHWHDWVWLHCVMSQNRWCHWHGWVSYSTASWVKIGGVIDMAESVTPLCYESKSLVSLRIQYVAMQNTEYFYFLKCCSCIYIHIFICLFLSAIDI